ncbi:MAG: trimethylamine methyltransferase family protein [Spirochaetales bacterium]|nr:trimethylamine methyltransferase family protein [Spirochaetales bacterium]
MLGAEPYPLKALIVSGGNPVNTDPNVGRAAEGFGRLELLVLRELFPTETRALADYVLPAASFLERSELHLYSHYQAESGTNLVHDVGYMEAGLANSPEMIVFPCEMIAMLRRFHEGFAIGRENLALEAIHQVEPGGKFLTEGHTMEHFREYWESDLFTRQRFDGGGGQLYLGSCRQV